MEVKVKLFVNLSGVTQGKQSTVTIDVPDTYTEEEITQEVENFLEDWANNQVETGWEIIE